jgi:hypothetical protein
MIPFLFISLSSPYALSPFYSPAMQVPPVAFPLPPQQPIQLGNQRIVENDEVKVLHL